MSPQWVCPLIQPSSALIGQQTTESEFPGQALCWGPSPVPLTHWLSTQHLRKVRHYVGLSVLTRLTLCLAMSHHHAGSCHVSISPRTAFSSSLPNGAEGEHALPSSHSHLLFDLSPAGCWKGLECLQIFPPCPISNCQLCNNQPIKFLKF